ncbi:prolyl oligopeptidase family serine peptidase [Pseudonocardia acidicola]|uniref:Prolyl oligopeptidase family serine peptidase n=1 Tax=Pseudonocardia acidicola TaxID=2724939 RepID=A0ABX1SDX3_9PSEU|nr:prolyl oligopeptidase family serine peptidase [Pseudonocardia acidicola]
MAGRRDGRHAVPPPRPGASLHRPWTGAAHSGVPAEHAELGPAGVEAVPRQGKRRGRCWGLASTYVDQVTAPILVLAGRNDPRCPARQIDNYLQALERAGGEPEVLRYDAGHGSSVSSTVETRILAAVAFARSITRAGGPGDEAADAASARRPATIRWRR